MGLATIVTNLFTKGNRQYGGNPINVESDYGGLAVDPYGPVTRLESYQFCTEADANTTMTVKFTNNLGEEATDPDHADYEIMEITVAINKDTRYKWVDVLNLALADAAQYGTSPGYTALKSTIIGIVFTPAANLRFMTPSPATAKRTLAYLRANGGVWTATTAAVLGRVG